ncbi:hypothetical protein D0X99_13315 [Algoriphagus lacus]|uniref:DUF4382 domain-containing protein n=1 Tax=Algoriphagus lacus TaxID=2056311 RepID=A0A418PQD8_9BACT|nr:hypothetical protein [Algoriphagus lacus]RIW14529.1 hypothetical protein D0X99_13315 [Algoriphagus lacus]
MNTTHKLYALSFGLLGLGLFSCSEDSDPDVIGEGDVRIGMGVKLSSSGNPGARILNAEIDVQSGFLQIKKIELETEGQDENGNLFEREFELKFKEIKKIDFNEFDAGVDFFINIPSGNYEEIEFDIDLIDNRNQPSIQLEGTYTYQDGRSVPMKFEVYGNDDDDFDFEVELEGDEDDDLFFLDGVNNPLALFQIDAQGWFSGVSTSELESAELTNGILLINNDVNKSIYRKVETRIKDSSDVELKMN